MNDIETRLAALANAVPSPAAPPRAAYDAAHRGWGGPAMTPRPAGHGAGPRAAAVPGAGCAPPYPSRAWPRSGGLLVAIMPRGSAPTPTGPAAADVVSALRTAPVADRGVRAAGLGFPGSTRHRCASSSHRPVATGLWSRDPPARASCA